MSIWNRLRVIGAARRNAGLGITPAVETVINAIIGVRPTLTTSNARHARIVRNLRPSASGQDRGEELREREDSYAAYFPPLAYLIGIILVGITDFWSAIRVMHDMGLPQGERLCFGFALAFGLIMLTAAVTRRAGDGVPRTASWARRVGLLLLCVVYGGVVFALAASRTEVAGDKDLFSKDVGPQLAIMTVITVGPAFAIEFLLRRFLDARRIKLGIRRLRQDQRGEKRRRREAERFTDRLSIDAESWDIAAAGLRALYELEYARAAAVRRPEPLMLPLTHTEGESDANA